MKKTTPFATYPNQSLAVSVIASQAYCEKQVDLMLKHPEILPPVPIEIVEEKTPIRLKKIEQQKERAKTGKEVHEIIASSHEVLSLPTATELLRSGKSLTLTELSLKGKFGKFPIIGRPDAVYFNGMNASSILDYKFTNNTKMEPHIDAQLRLYGYLIEKQKFNIDNLILICVFFPPDKKEWFYNLSSNKIQNLIRTIRKESSSCIKIGASQKYKWYHSIQIDKNLLIKSGISKYDPEKIRDELKFFTGYWSGKRDPKPTKKNYKCKSCKYNALKLCMDALAPFEDSI